MFNRTLIFSVVIFFQISTLLMGGCNSMGEIMKDGLDIYQKDRERDHQQTSDHQAQTSQEDTAAYEDTNPDDQHTQQPYEDTQNEDTQTSVYQSRVVQSQTPVTSVRMTASPKQCKLYSWWNAKRSDNFLTSNPTWSGSVGRIREGYRLYRIEGKIFCPNQKQPNGTVPLVSLWNSKRGDNFATTDSKWVKGPGSQDGYRRYRTEGFIYSHQRSGTTPLVSLWNPKRGDNFATTDSKWVNGPVSRDGYRRYRREGFVMR